MGDQASAMKYQRPFNQLHHLLTKFGFVVTKSDRGTYYQTWVQATAGTDEQLERYPFQLHIVTLANGESEINLKDGCFVHTYAETGGIPESIHTKTTAMINELRESLENNPQDMQRMDTTMNSMAPTEAEMRKLGDSMKEMQTNAQLEDEGLVPDPIQ